MQNRLTPFGVLGQARDAIISRQEESKDESKTIIPAPVLKDIELLMPVFQNQAEILSSQDHPLKKSYFSIANRLRACLKSFSM